MGLGISPNGLRRIRKNPSSNCAPIRKKCRKRKGPFGTSVFGHKPYDGPDPVLDSFGHAQRRIDSLGRDGKLKRMAAGGVGDGVCYGGGGGVVC